MSLSLEELARRARVLAGRRAEVVALLLDEGLRRDALARKSLADLAGLVEAARAEAGASYRWRGRGEIVLCTRDGESC